MAREKNPGLKILWVWTIGTAAIMVTNAVRTRLRDMEQAVNIDQQQPQHEQQNSNSTSELILVDPSPESDEGIIKEIKT